MTILKEHLQAEIKLYRSCWYHKYNYIIDPKLFSHKKGALA